MSNQLNQIIDSITPLNAAAMAAARERQAKLAKPPGSLGRLEELSVQLAGITGSVRNTIGKKYLLVFCADNGVVEEDVASAPKSVTLAQTINLTRGKTGASVLAKHFGCELRVIDVGVEASVSVSEVIDRKISYGTNNIAKGPAMTREQALKAICIGIDTISECLELNNNTLSDTVPQGVSVFGIGEMGIGNTTTSAAVLSVMTGLPEKDVTGKGAGITEEAYLNKISVIEQAISVNRPDPDDVIDIIAKVGGYDIAAMTGAFLAAAANRCPVVIDGFISAVAALCAYRLCPAAGEYFIPSHASYEQGYSIAMKELGLKPMLNLDMRLGEGSGCPLAMSLLEAACAVINNMATFDEAEINDDYLEPIRNTDAFTVKRN